MKLEFWVVKSKNNKLCQCPITEQILIMDGKDGHKKLKHLIDIMIKKGIEDLKECKIVKMEEVDK
jgi:hypothetical protein